MKTLYAVLGVVLLFFGPFAMGQSKLTQRVSFGVSQNDIYLFTENHYEITGDRTSSLAIYYSNESVNAMGWYAGYGLELSDRWEVALRLNYSGRNMSERVLELSGQTTNNGDFEYVFDRPRKYRALWQESLIFWRVFGPNVKPDIQIGTGFTYLYYTQDYRSGFEFDLDRATFEVEYFTRERKHSFGIPMQLQFQYPITYRFKVGFSVYGHHFFDGNEITGYSALVSYRL